MDSDEQSPHKDVAEHFWVKILTVPSLLLNTLVSTITLVGLQSHWTIHGTPYRRINNARATTQIVVQIIAGLLGAVHVLAVCKVINFYVRIALTRNPMPLHRLKFWKAITSAAPDWSISVKSQPLVIAWSLLALIPPALWTGSLTPVATTRSYVLPSAIRLPRYTANSYPYWSQSIFNPLFPVEVNAKGTFTYIPLQDRLGFLITDGSAATSVNDQPVQHTKNDNSNYTYIGRSYGIGSSVGLTDDSTQGRYGTTGYKYVETGYNSVVECLHNSSSLFALKLIVDGIQEPNWQTPSLFLATGPGPNTTESSDCAAGNVTSCGGFVTAGLGGDTNVTAAAWWASFEGGNSFNGLPRSTKHINTTRPPLSKAYTTLAAGSNYANLNKTQCSIQMIPTSFTVEVNTLYRTIQVAIQPDIRNVKDIEPTGFIADLASSVLGVMSGMDTTLYTSVIGNMLQRNIDNVHQLLNNTATTEQATLQGVSETLQALIDDHLLSSASAQLMVAKDTVPIEATISQIAFSIGTLEYAIAAVILNGLIVLLFTLEAFRTRIWAYLTSFDYEDINSVIVSASFGVHDAATQAMKPPISEHAASNLSVLLRPYEGMTLTLSSQPLRPWRSNFWGRGDRRGGGISQMRKREEQQSAAGVPLMEYPASNHAESQQLLVSRTEAPANEPSPSDGARKEAGESEDEGSRASRDD